MNTVYKNKCLNSRNPRILVTDEFIKNNNLSLSRTDKEIINKLKDKESDFFGFSREIILSHIDLKKLINLGILDSKFEISIKENYTYPDGTPIEPPITDVKETTQDFLDYLLFAYDKAINQRGLSASRSITKLSAWLWILGRSDLSSKIDDDDLYNPYGAPALISITRELGLPVPAELEEFASHPVLD